MLNLIKSCSQLDGGGRFKDFYEQIEKLRNVIFNRRDVNYLKFLLCYRVFNIAIINGVQ